ncbi:hypothetical protein AMST5_03361 [freshwater sediment metagenome]|uniref:DUF429 domain-containing protein n=1 Tax=freshwater sediment metagenome TaxID=556182 RepID=A0AA48M1X2_9ZZZZ
MFEKLIHADWSMHANKKWMAIAERTESGWRVSASCRVPPVSEFFEKHLFNGKTVLAGFDFPIGLPLAYGRTTGFDSFPEVLAMLGEGEWSDFFNVADKPEEISHRRPFYPRTAIRGHKQVHLMNGLQFASMDQLRRLCDRQTSKRRAACPIFWTLGANQVGRPQSMAGDPLSSPPFPTELACGHSLGRYTNCRNSLAVACSAKRTRKKHTPTWELNSRPAQASAIKPTAFGQENS